MEELEATFIVQLGDTETEMQLPITISAGQMLPVDVRLREVPEPPDIERPITAPAVLQHHWWMAEVKPVRVGPSTEHWDLRIEWDKQKPLIHWILQDNPLAVDETVAIFDWCDDHGWMKKGEKLEYIPPGKPGNPTRDTPAYIEIIDKGQVRIYESSDMFMKLDIMFDELKGHFVFIRREPSMNLWTFRREEASPKEVR